MQDNNNGNNSNNDNDNKGDKAQEDDGQPRALLSFLAGLAPAWFRRSQNSKSEEEHLREAIEDYIEELDETGSPSIAAHEKILISNVLKLRDLKIADVMVPRADIVGIDIDTPQDKLLKLLEEKQFSRLPVFRQDLDDAIGTIHIKDILSCLAQKRKIDIKELVREAPVVSPAMPVLDLLLEMQQKKKHMCLVIDEYGGVDGLVTIGDVVEAIVGEIEDEFETDAPAHMEDMPDGSILADARVDIEDFETRVGGILNEEEREDIDTLGGLVFTLAGRVPARGEILKHASGMVFEVLEADPRHISRLRIKNIPVRPGKEQRG